MKIFSYYTFLQAVARFPQEELHPGGVLPGFFLSHRNRPGSARSGAYTHHKRCVAGARTSRSSSTQPPASAMTSHDVNCAYSSPIFAVAEGSDDVRKVAA